MLYGCTIFFNDIHNMLFTVIEIKRRTFSMLFISSACRFDTIVVALYKIILNLCFDFFFNKYYYRLQYGNFYYHLSI